MRRKLWLMLGVTLLFGCSSRSSETASTGGGPATSIGASTDPEANEDEADGLRESGSGGAAPLVAAAETSDGGAETAPIEPAVEPRSPIVGAGGDDAGSKVDSSTAGAAGEGGSGGDAPVPKDGSGGDASAPVGGAGGAGDGSACTGLFDGTYCGGELEPAGDTNVRYFCVDEAVYATAACPGTCDPFSSTCVSASGPTEGADDQGAKSCETFCPTEADACAADLNCETHWACTRTCDGSKACAKLCTEALGDNPLHEALSRCCAGLR